MRKLSLFLCFFLILALLPVTASASENKAGGWYEVLEETALFDNGDNLFIIDGTETTITLDIEPHRRLAKVDMLLSYANGSLPSYIGVKYGDTYSQLSVVDLGNNICRAYGNITFAFYEDVVLRIVKSGTSKAYYELLSFKVCSLRVTDFSAQGKLYRSYSDPSPLNLPNNFSVAGNGGDDHMEYKLVPVRITDWTKYDYVTLFGSISTMALTSFRASIGNKGLPYTITYMESVPTGTEGSSDGSWVNSSTTTTIYNDNDYIRDDSTSYTDGTVYGGSENHSTVVYGGSVLFTITIDLTGIDRTTSGSLDCFFTCICSPALGYAFNVQNVSGSVLVADTSDVTWWNKFTAFMSDLFGGDSSQADEFADEMEQTNQELQDANDQLEAVTRPPVEEVPLDPSQFLDAGGMFYTGQIFQRLLGNDLVLPMASITLICGLAAFIIF